MLYNQLYADGRLLYPQSEAAGCVRCFARAHPGQYNDLLLSGKLWTYLADLNEQVDNWLASIISQMQAAEGVIEELKARDQLA